MEFRLLTRFKLSRDAGWKNFLHMKLLKPLPILFGFGKSFRQLKNMHALINAIFALNGRYYCSV